MMFGAKTTPLTLSAKAQRLLEEHSLRIWIRCDRMFAILLLVQWVAAVFAAAVISPRTWAMDTSRIHPHVWAAVFFGGLINLLPLYFVHTRPGAAITRQTVAVAQMLWSALLIHISGGRIETHFHVFGSLAFLAFYRDWRVLLTATVVVAADHMLRGIFWPESVFGIATASQWRWVEHAAWVIFEDIFLVMSCLQARREMAEVADTRARLEETNIAIEATVALRTAELNQSQVELKSAKEAAETANRAKTAFLANMSHEIRTPMTAILGYADILLEPNQDMSAKLNGIQVIRRNSEHLLAVINDILDISKIEAGKMEVEQISCSPAQVIADVSSLMGARASGKQIQLKVEFDGGIPATIRSDPTRLRQILINLVGNAIKFMERGDVRIVARLTDLARQPALQIDIVDSGIGMTPEQVGRLFRPFTQADGTTARKFGGSGLGLTISKRLAELLGGDISVRTAPNEGSTFSLTIRTGSLENIAMVYEPLDITEIDPASAQAPAATPENTRIDGLRILLAEDGIDNQRLIGHILRSRGAEVDIVENGRLAYDAAIIAAAREKPYHVILMDMQMPEMDGYAATSKLRQNGYAGTIVALTAHALDSDRDKCLGVGCDNYATKPINRNVLLGLLGEYHQRHFKSAAA
jgi:signal transduction histidine kinase/ActR/RegA family two-component response regulator